MSRYLGRLETRLSGRVLRVMQSNGGAVQAETATAAPVQTILSGPAGGVVRGVLSGLAKRLFKDHYV